MKIRRLRSGWSQELQDRCLRQVAESATIGSRPALSLATKRGIAGAMSASCVTHDELVAAVTMACLRAGPDTRASRHYRELVFEQRAPASACLGMLADRLELPKHGRVGRMQTAGDYARRAVDAARNKGIGVVPLLDPDYPPWLTHIVDPPIVLWTQGDLSHFHSPAVAVVGSRAATPTGLMMARRLGQELAEAGLVVVSGLARGIDAEAHRAALDAEGATIAVLGSGVDVIYPREHRELAARVTSRGLLVSELLPGTAPDAHHFPLRNRIISGLSVAVVVVEASERSGSLITARMALEQGRDVLAVPGNPASGRYRGCHALIKDGARLVETVEDVLDQIGWPRRPSGTRQPASNKTNQHSGLEVVMAAGEPYGLDDLSTRTGRTTPDLLDELGALELAGRVRRLAGGAYIRA